MSKKDELYTAKLRNASPLDLIFGDIVEDSTSSPDRSANTIPLHKIQLSTTQPRRFFDPQKLEELSISIKEFGILEPLIVLRKPDGIFELIAGERRYRSAGLAGLEEVPVVIKEFDDDTVKLVQLIENLQREDLNAYEETIGILDLLTLRLGLNHDAVISLLNRMDKANRQQADNVIRPEEKEIVDGVFKSIGRLSAESFRTNRLPLLNLPEDIKESLKNGLIEYTKARALNKLKDGEKRSYLLKIAINENLSLVEIQSRIKDAFNQEQTDSRPSLKNQYKELSKKLNSSKVWDNPKKRKELEKLLNQIKVLLG